MSSTNSGEVKHKNTKTCHCEKPFTRIWTRLWAIQLSQAHNPRKPSFATLLLTLRIRFECRLTQNLKILVRFATRTVFRKKRRTKCPLELRIVGSMKKIWLYINLFFTNSQLPIRVIFNIKKAALKKPLCIIILLLIILQVLIHRFQMLLP